MSPIRRHSDGWRVDVSLGRDPVTGRRRRVSKVVSGSKRLAQQEESRMLFEAGHAPSSASKMTLAHFLEQVWLPSKTDVRRRTREGYESKVKRHIIPALGHIAVGDLSPYVVQRWLDTMPRSPQTALHAYRVLHEAMKAAVVWQVIASNPLAAVKPPKVKRRQLDLPDAKEANVILDTFAGHAIEPAVVLALGAGLRRSEIVALDRTDVDLNAGTVTVTKGMHQSGKEVFPEDPKSQRSRRTVNLPDWAVEALKPRKGFGPLLVGHDGKRMTPDALTAAYKRKVKDAKLTYVPLRDLRHTHATLLLEAGEDVAIVSRRLGHSTISVTMDHYVHLHVTSDERAAERLSGLRTVRHRAPIAEDTAGHHGDS